jgi:multiple sugar transport system substrate-binding protein
MQDQILKEAPLKADFIPDPGPFNTAPEEKAGKLTVSLVGGLHGDMEPFVRAQLPEDLTPLAQNWAIATGTAIHGSRAHGRPDKTYYIPWMQATYVAINKEALQYLPQGPTSTR